MAGSRRYAARRGLESPAQVAKIGQLGEGECACVDDPDPSGQGKTPPGLTRQYLVALLAGFLLLFVLGWLAQKITGNAPRIPGLSLILPGFAAMSVAPAWIARDGVRPSSGRIWLQSVLWAAPVLAIQLVWFALIWSRSGFGATGLQGYNDPVVATVALALAAILLILAVRSGLWLGFRLAEKAAAKR